MEEDLGTIVELMGKVLLGSTITSIILGVPLNILIVSAILTSPSLRLKLRNQIIAISCVCFLLLISIESVLSIIMHTELHVFDCMFFNIFTSADVIADFISLWYVALLLSVYIAQLKDFDPSKRLSRRCVQIGSTAIIAIPLLLAAIIMPPSIAVFTTQSVQDTCVFISDEDSQKLELASTIAPLLIAIILTAVAVVIYRRRFRLWPFSQSAGVELMNRGTVVDEPVAYIVAVSICVVCYIVNIFLIFYLGKIGSELTIFKVTIADEVFQDAFTYLLPLSWLFLDDVRERIKTWRPWRRTRQNIEITVSYSKEETPDEARASSNE